MAIQNRRGDYSDFDPQKLVPGEWAVVLSGDPHSERGKAVYMAFDVGEIERMATYEDMEENIVSATSDVQAQFAAELTQTIANANAAVGVMRNDVDTEIASAINTVNALSTQANLATGNAKVATEQANQAAETAYDAADSVQSIIDAGSTVASWNNRVGLVVPQAGDYTSAQITHNNTTVADALGFDAVPVANSTRAVQSGGVFSRLGNTDLETTASTITGAIAEIRDAIYAEIENRVKDYVVRVSIPCGALSPVEGTGTIDAYIDITNNIPAGYKAFDVRCALTQSYVFYCWWCDFNNETNTQVRIRFQRSDSGTGGTIYPWIVVTCVKDWT